MVQYGVHRSTRPSRPWPVVRRRSVDRGSPVVAGLRDRCCSSLRGDPREPDLRPPWPRRKQSRQLIGVARQVLGRWPTSSWRGILWHRLLRRSASSLGGYVAVPGQPPPTAVTPPLTRRWPALKRRKTVPGLEVLCSPRKHYSGLLAAASGCFCHPGHRLGRHSHHRSQHELLRARLLSSLLARSLLRFGAGVLPLTDEPSSQMLS
jgi:hypothetical protein